MIDIVFPVANSLQFPVTPYKVAGHTFGKRVRSRIILWARHLGDDVLLDPGTPVHAIADGYVVWSEVRPGSAQTPNWGGIVVVGHRHKDTGEAFYSLYGHIKDIAVKVGQTIQAGDTIGVVAEGKTPENGWWKIPHVHFGLYAGPWTGKVLPGYKRPFEGRTKINWWRNPRQFIKEYDQ